MGFFCCRCYLTLPDYINFGYSLPPVCIDDEMHATLAELGNLSRKVLRVARPQSNLAKGVGYVKGLVTQALGVTVEAPLTTRGKARLKRLRRFGASDSAEEDGSMSDGKGEGGEQTKSTGQGKGRSKGELGGSGDKPDGGDAVRDHKDKQGEAAAGVAA